MAFDAVLLLVLLSLPVRMVLFTAHVYLLNVFYLLQIVCLCIKPVAMQLVSMMRNLRFMGLLMPNGGILLTLMKHNLDLMYIEMHFILKVLMLLVKLLNLLSTMLDRLSYLLRDWADSRTWIIKLRLR